MGELAKTIAFLRDCQRRHQEWAEYFEQNPDAEQAYTATGEWDTAKKHREIEQEYDKVIQALNRFAQTEAERDALKARLSALEKLKGE